MRSGVDWWDLGMRSGRKIRTRPEIAIGNSTTFFLEQVECRRLRMSPIFGTQNSQFWDREVFATVIADK